MSWFHNLSIRSKVMTAFAAVLAVTIVLGVFSINRLSIVNEGAVTISDNYLVAANGLSDLGQNAMRYRQLQGSFLLMADADTRATTTRSLSTSQAESEKGWVTYSPTIGAGYERDIADKFHSELTDYLAMNDKFMALANTGKTAEASAYYTGEMRTLYNKFWADLQADEAYQLKMG